VLQNPIASPLARRRAIGSVIWLVAFVIVCFLWGLPTDPLFALLWLWIATICWNSHWPVRDHLRFVRDWAPIAIVLVVYNLSRGYADNGVNPHAEAMVRADIDMWGWATGGQTPTVWLQHHLYDPNHVRWYDTLASAVYFSHFVLAPTIAGVLWIRDRPLWGKFMRRWVTLFAAGLLTYFLYPAAPPWWAAEHGLIDPVVRISTRGWAAIGLHGAGNLLNAAQLDAANPIAAMPSLHTAFAVLCVGFFVPRVRARFWPLLALYPLAMMWTLVYSGEHWVIDALAGIGYAVVVLVGVSLAERGWARWRRSDEPAPEPEPATVSSSPPN
jgi:hypothetical protein